MSLVQSLYFIAVVPHQQLSERITTLKQDFSRKYNCFAALKSMPHVTLQNPFKRGPEAEVEMHLRLQEFFEKYPAIEIELNGFGCFDNPSNKVVFTAVVKNEKLLNLHKALMHYLQTELKFTPGETGYAYHPHITIANRDLSAENFRKAWPLYKDRPFNGAFKADCVYLFKHDYHRWQVLSRFELSKR